MQNTLGGVTLVFETIRTLLAEQLGYDESRISRRSSLSDDLEAELTDLQEIMILLEQEYEIEWTEEDLLRLNTVADLISFVESQTE